MGEQNIQRSGLAVLDLLLLGAEGARVVGTVVVASQDVDSIGTLQIVRNLLDILKTVLWLTRQSQSLPAHCDC